MSFSDVKTELILAAKNKNERLAMLLGIFSFCGECSKERVVIKCLREDVTSFCVDVIDKYLGIKLKTGIYTWLTDLYYALSVDIEDNKKIKQCIDKIKHDVFVNKKYLKNFISGCFLSTGYLKKPSTKYYLEFILKNELAGAELEEILKDQGFKFKEKIRHNKKVIYINNSSDIEDLLTYLGATKASLEIMNLKVYKDLRNKVNRIVNCETYNISKVISATNEQIKSINKIKEIKGLDWLKEDLKEIAEKRLENPDKSLIELCDILSFEITKSGLYYRLKKIESIAKELDDWK